jgi:succinate dehydrogenase/fumarate reductase cytochrome b subunit
MSDYPLQCPFQVEIFDKQFETIKSSLPTFYRESDKVHTVTEIDENTAGIYMRKDLDVSRLNNIHRYMWTCGRPLNARALHRQKVMQREVVVTEQADLHLLYHDNTLFVKPLPQYLLSPLAWTQYINRDQSLHMDACGFLLSYIWLLRSPTDFLIAQKQNLVPSELKWSSWRILVHQFLIAVDATSLHQVNRRYHFGELRLNRVNSAYRMIPRLAVNHFIRGYLYGYNRYAAFFQRSFGWILILFIWFSLILSAMQVGTSLPKFDGMHAFYDTCLGFVVFSIVLVAALVVFIGVLFAVVFFYNMIAAICHARDQVRRRKAVQHKAVG